jgi:hypothetical protein
MYLDQISRGTGIERTMLADNLHRTPIEYLFDQPGFDQLIVREQ